jgi:hypothetical protein
MTTKMKSAARELTHHLKVCKFVLKDAQAPKQAKILLQFAVAFIPFPFSTIISPIFIIIALRMIPKEVIEVCKVRVNS